jgi:O-antigen/teichoic acid export membrane protein
VFVAIPALAGISVLSETVVSLAFGDRWLAAATPLAVLALASAVTSTSALCGVLASAVGRPHITIPAQAIGVVVLGFGLAVTVPSGDLTMISWSVLAAAVTTSIGLYLATGPLIALTLGRLVTELIPVIVPTFVMYASLWLIRDAVTVRLATLPAAIVLVAMGVLIYVALSWVFFRSAFTEQLRSVRLIVNPKLSASERGTAS